MPGPNGPASAKPHDDPDSNTNPGPKTEAQKLDVPDIMPTAKELEVAGIDFQPAPYLTPRMSREDAIAVGVWLHFGKKGWEPTHTAAGATFGLVTDKGARIVAEYRPGSDESARIDAEPAWIVTIEGVWVPPPSGMAEKEYEPTGIAITVVSDATGEQISGGVTLNYPLGADRK